MWIKATAFIVFALGAGATAGVMNSDSDAGRDMRLAATGFFGPVADLMASSRDGHFYSADPVTGRPTSVLDSLVNGGGKPDPDVIGCVRDAGDDVMQTVRELAEFHSHRPTATFVTCLLQRNPRRFCTPQGRQQAADALEFYLWSRDNGRNPSHSQQMAYKIRHLEDDTALAPANGDVDPNERTWDGPEDHAVFDEFKRLIAAGYLDADAFGRFPRAEVRDALAGAKTHGAACANAQTAG